MRKCLMCVMGVLLVLGLVAHASADWVTDVCGDSIVHGGGYPSVADKDIEAVKVAFYDDYVNLCIDMCDGSTLPGLIIWEFDVDDNSATGGSQGMLGIPINPLPVKTCSGYDLVIMKVLRHQGPTSSSDPGQKICYITDDLCTGACEWPGECYQRTGVCVRTSTNPSCRVILGTCNNCNEPECFRFGGTCSDTEDANIGRKAGEWFVFPNIMYGTPIPGPLVVDWGRNMPVVGETGVDNHYCEKLPWQQIIDAVKATDGYDATAFDNLAPQPRYQVSTYYDPYYPDDQDGNVDDLDDFLDSLTTDYVNITDWMPNGDQTKADSQATDGGYCHKYQTKIDTCMEKMAEQFNLDLDECITYGDQPSCENAGCYWNVTESKCTLDICLADMDGDNYVALGDLELVKRGYGRTDCP